MQPVRQAFAVIDGAEGRAHQRVDFVAGEPLQRERAARAGSDPRARAPRCGASRIVGEHEQHAARPDAVRSADSSASELIVGALRRAIASTSGAWFASRSNHASNAVCGACAPRADRAGRSTGLRSAGDAGTRRIGQEARERGGVVAHRRARELRIDREQRVRNLRGPPRYGPRCISASTTIAVAPSSRASIASSASSGPPPMPALRRQRRDRATRRDARALTHLRSLARSRARPTVGRSTGSCRRGRARSLGSCRDRRRGDR